jgi:transposase InsO family protein
VRASFLASDRTYGARRVRKDLAADGVFSGLHRVERLMRLQAPKARPRRRRLPPDLGDRPVGSIAPNVLDRGFEATAPNPNGSRTSPMSGPRKAGCTLQPSSICSRGAWSAGR